MAITQPTAGTLGDCSTEVATNNAADGDYSGRLGNALLTLASEAQTGATGVNGTTVTAGGALTTGNVLTATGVAAAGWSAVNLAGGSGYVSGILPAANSMQQVRAARGVVVANVANLAAFTVADSGGVNDGLTFVEGDVVLLVNQTTASQDGPYTVGVVGGGTAALTRPSWWAAASVQPASVVFEINAGTYYALSSWKATVAGSVTVGTTSPAFYPRVFRRTITLAAGTYTIGVGSSATPDEPLFLLSTTLSTVNITRDTAGGTLTGTVMYVAPVADRVAGTRGTAVVVVRSAVEAGTIQNQDTSTLSVLVTNW